ncbi:MAG: glycosyltransferase family 39 protein [Bacteroidetes bacterium]|nr:glycosyltransferase family 39 protein [Bacteroidota bacterium]
MNFRSFQSYHAIILLTITFVGLFGGFVIDGFVDIDSQAFQAIAFHLQQGKILYTDVWDAKPPGIYHLNKLAFLFMGASQFTTWMLQAVIGVIQCLLVYDILKRLTRNTLTAWCGSLLYMKLAYFSSLYQGGNFTEEYANLFLVLGIFFLTRFQDKPVNGWFLGMGLASFSMCPMFNEPYLITILPWLIYGLWLLKLAKTKKKRIIVVSVAFLPLALFLSYLILENSLTQFIAHLSYNAAYASDLRVPFMDRVQQNLSFFATQLDASALPLYVIIVITAFIVWWKFHPPVLIKLAIIQLPLSLLTVSMSGYQFQHYFLEWLPPLVLIITFSWDVFFRKAINHTWSTSLLPAITLALFIFIPWRSTEPDKIRFVDTETYLKNHRTHSSSLYIQPVEHTDLYMATGLCSNQTIPISFFSYFMVNDPGSANRIESFVTSFYTQPPTYILTSEASGMLNKHLELAHWFNRHYVLIHRETRNSQTLNLFQFHEN